MTLKPWTVKNSTLIDGALGIGTKFIIFSCLKIWYKCTYGPIYVKFQIFLYVGAKPQNEIIKFEITINNKIQ
jgi:hypothetical protein